MTSVKSSTADSKAGSTVESTRRFGLSSTGAQDDAQMPKQQDSLTRAALRAFLRHRSGLAGLAITLLLFVLALVAPWLAPFDPVGMTTADRFMAPTSTYPLGTDSYGRDIFSRVLFGGRIAFGVGGISVAMATVVGVSLGSISGYVLGWFDAISMRIMDVIIAFPAILLAIVILAILGPGVWNAMLAVAIVNVPIFARLARANVLAEKGKEYVLASRAIGAPPHRILFQNILPNSLATIIVQVTVSFAWAILLESSLSFLGLGVPPPNPSWGAMLSEGRTVMSRTPWPSIAPGLAIMTLVLGAYLLGDGLRDVLDPRRQKSI